RHHRALQERRPRHGARHRPARRLRARHVRHLDDDAARLRHHEARRGADARDHWPTSAAIYLKDGKPAETGKLFTNPTLAATYTRVLKEAESAGGDRVAQIEKARKVWSQGFVAQAI